MPFTLAHPAAVIPLKNHPIGKHLILSALVVGSLMPDVGYFAPYPAFSGFSHSLGGSILFDLPLGLLGLWLFHQLCILCSNISAPALV